MPEPIQAPGTAVVTGAATGLGRSFARHLASLGHAVAVCDVVACDEVVSEIRSSGGTALGARADVSQEHDVARFVDLVHHELGAATILVNNVGISPYAAFEDVTFDQWRTVLSVNLDSLFLVTRALLPDMVSSGYGRVVNMASSVAWDARSSDMVPYITSKMGVVGFTRSLATEVGSHKITVNCIAPGLTETPALRERVRPEHWEQVRHQQAVEQTLQPDDLLGALAFLVSPEARMVTGAVVAVNGGRIWL